MDHFYLLFGFSEQIPESINLHILEGMNRGEEEEGGQPYHMGKER